MFYALTSLPSHPAVIHENKVYLYHQLNGLVDDFISQLPDKRSLVALYAKNDLATLVAYLGLLRAGHVTLLLDAHANPEFAHQLIQHYGCNGSVENGEFTKLNDVNVSLDDELALLLSTSGSTGTPKQVALSRGNLQSNAQAICQYLPIVSSDTTITTLPFAYSYGLSVINSHLECGACLCLNELSVMEKGFWQALDMHQISSFAGVPFQYEMLHRLRFHRKTLPSLRYFTQAGGKLNETLAAYFAEYAQDNDMAFFLMYGQTEATARMAFNQVAPSSGKAMPPNFASIGKPIPGGRFEVREPNGEVINQPNKTGALFYQGPNVMLGYAQHATDLAAFSPYSWLATGDLAYFDENGEYVIAGRLKRFVKITGKRISLDDVEQWMTQQGYHCYCVGRDGVIQVAVQTQDLINLENWQHKVKTQVGQYLSIHPSFIEVYKFDTLPINRNGKKDYQALMEQLSE